MHLLAPTRSSRLNARYRRAVKARGHFPTEQAALKCLYLVTRSLDPTGHRAGTMGHAVEASPERVRHHLRRPLAGSRNLLMKTAGNTVAVTDPSRKERRILAVNATDRGPICSIGFLKPRRLRGRLLSSAATRSRSSALLQAARSVPFGCLCVCQAAASAVVAS